MGRESVKLSWLWLHSIPVDWGDENIAFRDLLDG